MNYTRGPCHELMLSLWDWKKGRLVANLLNIVTCILDGAI